jgi:hypothetical protein
MGRYFSTIPDDVPPEEMWEDQLRGMLSVMERVNPSLGRSAVKDAEALVRVAWRLLYEERVAREARDASEGASKAA